MGRCGCSSVGATGAAMVSSNCIAVTGAGTASSPFHVDAVIDPAADNLVECGLNGLYARAPVITSNNDTINVADGAGLGDYDLSVHISGDDFQGLTVVGDGLLAWSNMEVRAYGNSVYGGSPGTSPGQSRWRVYIGTYAAATGAAGELIVPLPAGCFPNGILTVVHSEGDVTVVPHHVQLRLADTDTTQLAFLVRDFDGTTTVGVNIRVNFEVIGW